MRLLKSVQEGGPSHNLGIISAADPLNLTGIIGDAPRVPRRRKLRIICKGGVPIAVWGNSALQRLVKDTTTDHQLLCCVADSNTLKAAQAGPVWRQPPWGSGHQNPTAS